MHYNGTCVLKCFSAAKKEGVVGDFLHMVWIANYPGASNVELDDSSCLLFAFSNCFAVSSQKNVGNI